jgi:hypothetical protein
VSLIDARLNAEPGKATAPVVDLWGDPLGGSAQSGLDRRARMEAFGAEITAALRQVDKAAVALSTLDRRRLAAPQFAGFRAPVEQAAAGLAAAVADVLATLAGDR